MLWIWVGFLSALLPHTNALTDITLLNCPAQFNVTLYNTSTDTTMSTIGSFLYASFQSSSSRSTVQRIVVEGNTNLLSSYSQQLMVPYIIVGVLFFVFFILIVTGCLFDKSCPPCQKIRRDTSEDPYTKGQIRCYTILTMLSAAGVLILCVVAFEQIPTMRSNLQMTSCSVYLALDTAMNGDSGWGGFTYLRDQIGNITNLLPAAVTQIQIYFPGDSWLVDTMQAMRTANINIYNKYKNAQLTTPNPDSTQTASNAGQSTPLVDSRFIKTGMGPNTTANTMASLIDNALRQYRINQLSDQAYKITAGAALLTSSLQNILNNSQSSQNILLMYNYQLNTSTTQFGTLNQDYFVDKFSTALSAFQAIFAFALTGSLIALLGVLATHTFQLPICRRMVHLGWTVWGLVYSGVIIVCFVTLSLGSIGYGFCDYFNSMLTDQNSFNLIGQSYTQNTMMRLDTCIFGSGNALEKFSMGKQMQTVMGLFTDIQKYYDYQNAASANYINLNIASNVVAGWITAINNYKNGVYRDTDITITNNDNPNYAIDQLNLYTYQGGGVPTGSKDVWVWDKINCSSNYIIYNSTGSMGTTLSTTNVTCISFNEKISSSSGSSWSFSDFTMRYTQIRQSFNDAYKQIVFFGNTLIAFRDSRINLFTAIADDLVALAASLTAFNTQMANLKSRVDQFYSAVSTLNNLITNPLTGLAVSNNCRPIADKLKFTKNVFCVNFMSQICKLALCSLLMLGFMFVGVIAGSKFGIIYAELQKQRRINQPDEQQSGKDIHMNDQTHSSESED